MDVKKTLLSSGDIPNEQEVIDRLKEVESVVIPYVLKDRIILSPGQWNSFYYTPEHIKKGVEQTVWNEETRSIFYEHSDRDARDWVGDLKNIRVSDNGVAIADLWLIDKPLAQKLAYGAKFAISPKIVGDDDVHKVIRDIRFKNFGLVLDPGCKTTFLNSEIPELQITTNNKQVIVEEPTPIKEPTPIVEPKPEKVFTNNNNGGNVKMDENELKNVSEKLDSLTKNLEILTKTTMELDADRQRRLKAEQEAEAKLMADKTAAEKKAIEAEMKAKDELINQAKAEAEAKAKELQDKINALNGELEQTKNIVNATKPEPKPEDKPVAPTVEEAPKTAPVTQPLPSEVITAENMRVLDKTSSPAGFTNTYTDGDVAMAKYLKDSVEQSAESGGQ
ncbi:MAG: hypothetical protein WC307_06740 [Candidatus Nanoarchaeia archaeon]|jgi:hypothetical protein